MKINIKTKVFTIFLFIGVSFAFSTANSYIISTNPSNIEVISPTEIIAPKTSYFNLSEAPIFINGSDIRPDNKNWAWAITQEWCQLIDEIYVIENLTIDAQNKTSCIEIHNSNVKFRIKNCTLINANGTNGEAGIKLINVTNDFSSFLSQEEKVGIYGNNVSFNNIGISLQTNSTYNVFKNNNIMNNTEYGLIIYNITGTSSFNWVTENNFTGNGIHAFDNCSENIWGLKDEDSSLYVLGNSWSNYSQLFGVADANDDGIGDVPYPIPGEGGHFDAMPIYKDGYDGAPLIIDNSGSRTHVTWEWATTLAWCEGLGTLANPYLISDLIINGENSGNCIEIYSSDDVYFTIKNCTVLNSSLSSQKAGIRLESVNNGTLINNNCSYNNNIGMHLNHCENITIIGNVINNNFVNGLLIEFGNDIDILRNNISYNNEAGIITTQNNVLLVYNNNITNNKYGISLLNSEDCNITCNNLHKNDQTGIRLYYSNQTIISNNIANDCASYGLYITNGKDNYCKDNDLSSNGVSGVYISNGVNNNISNCDILNSGSHGIHFEDSNSSYIVNNTISYNLQDSGIYLRYSDFNVIWNNTVNNNTEYGIHLHYSDNNTIRGNIITGNIIHCIYQYYCNGNIFEYNGDCVPITVDPPPNGTPPQGRGPVIPGFDVFILIGTACLLSVLLLRKRRK